MINETKEEKLAQLFKLPTTPKSFTSEDNFIKSKNEDSEEIVRDSENSNKFANVFNADVSCESSGFVIIDSIVNRDSFIAETQPIIQSTFDSEDDTSYSTSISSSIKDESSEKTIQEIDEIKEIIPDSPIEENKISELKNDIYNCSYDDISYSEVLGLMHFYHYNEIPGCTNFYLNDDKDSDSLDYLPILEDNAEYKVKKLRVYDAIGELFNKKKTEEIPIDRYNENLRRKAKSNENTFEIILKELENEGLITFNMIRDKILKKNNDH